MANTLIQIKRSTTSNTPASLNIAEQAYSYVSSKLFIGNQAGDGAVEIGGKYWVDQTSYIGGVANGALQRSGGTMTGALTVQNDVSITGNLTISGTTTYANTQTLNIGDNIFSLNADMPSNVSPTENAGMEVNRGNANTVSLFWNESTDKWSLTDANLFAYSIATNTDIELAISSSAASMNASNLTTGTVPTGRMSGSYTGITGVGTLTVGTWNANTITVPYGGTGLTTVTTNGILFGNGANALQVTSAGTEGQVLQANASGVPQFGMLDGGSF